MRKMFRAVVVGTFIAMGFAGAASASTFVWKDPVSDFTFSFPDSWTLQTNDLPTTRVRIAGPIGEDFATCRVKAEKDGRAQIYPKSLMTKAVKAKLDIEFWEHEVGQYDHGLITHYYAPANLGGQGDATAVRAYFMQDGGAGKMNMYGTMIGSIYGDMRYTVSCSSKIEEFKKYAPVFSTIMSSVALDSKYHPYATGYYRNFLNDPQLMLPRSKPGTIFRKSDFLSPSLF